MLKKEYLIYKLSEAAREACKIDNELFPMYNVKRGLRNEASGASSYKEREYRSYRSNGSCSASVKT